MSSINRKKKRWPGRKARKPYQEAVLVEAVNRTGATIWSVDDALNWNYFYVPELYIPAVPAPEKGSIVILQLMAGQLMAGENRWKIVR